LNDACEHNSNYAGVMRWDVSVILFQQFSDHNDYSVCRMFEKWMRLGEKEICLQVNTGETIDGGRRTNERKSRL